MVRNTRSRRGEAATAMQEDPEAILRSGRQRARAAGRQTPQVEAGEQGRPGTQAAAPAQEESSRQTAGGDSQGGNGTEDNRLQDETSAQPGGDTNGPGEKSVPQTSATSDQQTSSDAHEQAGAPSRRHGDDSSAPTTDPVKDTSASEGTTSPTQQEEHVGGNPETRKPAHVENEQAQGGKHDLEGKNEEESEPKRTRQECEGAGPAGNRDGQGQPPSNPCQDFRDALRTFEELARRGQALSAENNFEHGEYLPDEVLHQAIASVTEAISERGLVAFSLLDRLNESQPAARRGQNFMWVQHRTRGNTPGGHFSLFIVDWDEEGHRYHTEHRDSFQTTRSGRAVQEAWQAARQALSAGERFRWQRDERPALPEEIHVPAGQFNQSQNWTCGLCTVLNAWIHALGLPRSQNGRPHMNGMFTIEACTLVRCALQGPMNSQTIRNFLECYNFIEAGSHIEADRTFDRTFAFRSANAFAERIATVRLREERDTLIDDPDLPSSDEMLLILEGAERRINPIAYDSIHDLVGEYLGYLNALSGNSGPGDDAGGTDTNEDGHDTASAQDDDESYALRVQNEEYQRTPPPGGQAAGQGSSGTDTQQQRPIVPPPAGGSDNDAESGPQQQSSAGPHETSSGPESQSRPPQQTNAQDQRDAADQGEASGGQTHEGENASAASGAQNEANRNERENAPSPDEEMRRSQRPAGRPSEEEQEEDAATRRQRALDRLRPPNDPFRPGRPLRPATADVQRGLDQGESELSMIIAPYSDLPRHQTLRNQYGLPNLTDVFNRPEQNEPPAQQQVGQASPAPPAAAAADEVPQQDSQPPASNALQQPPAPGAPQQPPASGSNAVQDEQNNNASDSNPPPPGSTSASAANPQPPAPAAGEPRIPGLQSTIPPPSTGLGPTSAPATNAAGGTNGSSDQPSGRRAASQESLPDYEYYEEQERQQQLERERQELQRRGREFEQETQQGRQRAREERDEADEAEGQGEDGDDGFGSLFGEAGSSETEAGE